MIERVTFEYRKDGWPLCPKCGEDELASVELLNGHTSEAKASDRMLCYKCRWEGTVPLKDS